MTGYRFLGIQNKQNPDPMNTLFRSIRSCRMRALAVLSVLVLGGCRETSHPVPALIPMPQSVAWTGDDFQLPENGEGVTRELTAELAGVPSHSDEGYLLTVTRNGVVLRATTPAGLFRGEQTLRQLTCQRRGKQYVAGCAIADWPAFAFRGFMQDVGRNYMSLPFLKEQIDVLAAYKYNYFHLHMTDNPGWRLESRLYPRLKDSASMSRWPGKYYTQEEFADLVEYCRERHITLIPELDVPGHCAAFRKALGLETMCDPRVKTILTDLVVELCGLILPEDMPYIHLGTDEVWQDHERPAPDLLPHLVRTIREQGREVIVWRPGQSIENDTTSITQLWSSNGLPKPGHRYLDSRLNYLNHLDPLAGVGQLYFDRICGAPQGDSLRLGGILCCWNDNNVAEERDIVRQNPVYPGILTYSETSWKGQPADLGEQYLARLPLPGDSLHESFRDFEKRLIRHRDLYFKGKPFPYVAQTDIFWTIIGPFDHGGDVGRKFAVEDTLMERYPADGKEYAWTGPYPGGTLHIRHFFGFPSWFQQREGTVYALTYLWSPGDQRVDCWIGFHDWSRSAGRRGGPTPPQGEWHTSLPRVWVNADPIAPPVWKNPGVPADSEEIPLQDENYFFRDPSQINLKKGWNRILLKVPHRADSWKWMFTFVPLSIRDGQPQELQGLRFHPSPGTPYRF